MLLILSLFVTSYSSTSLDLSCYESVRNSIILYIYGLKDALVSIWALILCSMAMSTKLSLPQSTEASLGEKYLSMVNLIIFTIRKILQLRKAASMFSFLLFLQASLCFLFPTQAQYLVRMMAAEPQILQWRHFCCGSWGTFISRLTGGMKTHPRSSAQTHHFSGDFISDMWYTFYNHNVSTRFSFFELYLQLYYITIIIIILCFSEFPRYFTIIIIAKTWILTIY